MAPIQHSHKDCEDGVREFLQQLTPGQNPTVRAYDAWRRQHPEHPWAASFRRHGGFRAIRATVQRERQNVSV